MKYELTEEQESAKQQLKAFKYLHGACTWAIGLGYEQDLVFLAIPKSKEGTPGPPLRLHNNFPWKWKMKNVVKLRGK